MPDKNLIYRNIELLISDLVNLQAELEPRNSEKYYKLIKDEKNNLGIFLNLDAIADEFLLKKIEYTNKFGDDNLERTSFYLGSENTHRNSSFGYKFGIVDENNQIKPYFWVGNDSIVGLPMIIDYRKMLLDPKNNIKFTVHYSNDEMFAREYINALDNYQNLLVHSIKNPHNYSKQNSVFADIELFGSHKLAKVDDNYIKEVEQKYDPMKKIA